MKPSIVILFILIFNVCLGGTTDPSINDSEYVEYGKKFHCVVKLCGTYKDNSQFCASAVLIDNHNFLTAAHIIHNYESAYIMINNKKINVKSIIAHKQFNYDLGLHDIAIGYCDISFDLEKYPELYDNDDELDKLCSISGFGIHGTFKTGATIFDDKRRAGLNIIDSVSSDLLVCSPSDIGSKNRTKLEFLIASGDSGGGLFIDGRLAGINSYVMAIDKKPDSTYTDESGHTRVSKFIGWIKEHRIKK